MEREDEDVLYDVATGEVHCGGECADRFQRLRVIRRQFQTLEASDRLACLRALCEVAVESGVEGVVYRDDYTVNRAYMESGYWVPEECDDE
jgi:hypothetical protein